MERSLEGRGDLVRGEGGEVFDGEGEGWIWGGVLRGGSVGEGSFGMRCTLWLSLEADLSISLMSLLERALVFWWKRESVLKRAFHAGLSILCARYLGVPASMQGPSAVKFDREMGCCQNMSSIQMKRLFR